MKSFKHQTTEFRLTYSPVNSGYIFTRADGGYNTETAVFQDKAEAHKYFADKVEFFKQVKGLN